MPLSTADNAITHKESRQTGVTDILPDKNKDNGKKSYSGTRPAPRLKTSTVSDKNAGLVDREYLTLLRNVLESNLKSNLKSNDIAPLANLPDTYIGEQDTDYQCASNRTGVDTLRLFGQQIRCDLTQGFPLLTTKKLHFPSIAHELLWFIRGETNIRSLNEHGVSIWDEWADENGELGRVYGAQWRGWRRGNDESIDQLRNVLRLIKEEPHSRRMIVNSWRVDELEDMALPPCHLLYQFFVDHNKLSCQVYQRSADLFLGVPFNIASYALLTHMVAHVTGLQPAELVLVFGDAHIYTNHLEQVQKQLERKPFPLPELRINKETNSPDDLFELTYDDLQLVDYRAHAHIKAAVAV